ncbi:MAG: type II secretion system F family protein [Fuscovulum sp.]|nr:type II secretion system F family protein [Fuscovulum sp.]
MLSYLQALSIRLGLPLESLLAIGVGLGVLLLLWAVLTAVRRPDPAVQRIAAIAGARRLDRMDRALLLPSAKGPSGLMKAFVPTREEKLGALQRKLIQAGVTRPNAVGLYTAVRIALALGLPLAFLGLTALARLPGTPLPAAVQAWLVGRSTIGTYQILSILLALGYFLPFKWLEAKAAARRRRIEEAFPNALDLLQVSVEAGLGFDAAMTRVGNELRRAAPEIAQEFLAVQFQVQAGKARDQAMREMADRVGIDTIRSFAGMVQQSMMFGTSMSQAMTTYAEEMRLIREVRAQEMANKLPVKMSGVMASLMLPALVLLTIGPVIIRYMRQF